MKFKDLTDMISQDGSSSSVSRIEMDRMKSRVMELEKRLRDNSMSLQKQSARDLIVTSSSLIRHGADKKDPNIDMSDTIINTLISL